MLKPSANKITTPHRSQYSLVIAVAKRARDIANEAERNHEILVEKPVDLAVQDFMENKFKIVEPDPEDYLDLDKPHPSPVAEESKSSSEEKEEAQDSSEEDKSEGDSKTEE